MIIPPDWLGGVFKAQSRARQYFSLGISGLVFFLLAGRVAMKMTTHSLAPPVVIAPWGTGVGLTVRMDGMSLAFLFIPVLLLIALFWAYQNTDFAVLMGLAGTSALVFIAANGIGFSYALLLFDIVGCIYWLHNKHTNLALARLALSVATTIALMLVGLSPTTLAGGTVLAFALWLRIGVFPFVEISIWSDEKLTTEEAMVWLALSTAVGLYVAARFLVIPVPSFVYVLMSLTLLLNACLAWLGETSAEKIRIKLLQMVLIQPGLALLISPLPARVSITLALGYTMALGALWIMPRVGKPNVFERHWLWIYATPVLATLSLIGFPFTFGWVVHRQIYTDLLLENRQGVLALILLTEGIAFSVLYEYWRKLLAGNDKKEKPLLTALILTVPFLFPGLAGLVFSVITGLELNGAESASAPISAATIFTQLLIVWALAVGFGYGRRWLLDKLGINPRTVESVLRLGWLWPWVWLGANKVSRGVLWFKAILEGGHYLGWAFLLALTGILVVILR